EQFVRVRVVVRRTTDQQVVALAPEKRAGRERPGDEDVPARSAVEYVAAGADQDVVAAAADDVADVDDAAAQAGRLSEGQIDVAAVAHAGRDVVGRGGNGKHLGGAQAAIVDGDLV